MEEKQIYVWEGFCPDYTDGLAFAVAENEAEAREMVEKEVGHEVDNWGQLTILPLDRKAAFFVEGGG